MSKKYQRRVSDLIRDRLTTLLHRKINDPRLEMITITDVEVTPDAERADVHYSLLGSDEARADAQEGLDSAAGWLRRELGHSLRLRNTPELVFHFDPSLERGEHIAGILDGLRFADEDDEDSDVDGE
ncbi:MAG: 30S ribosome-binding factor RbfA [Chloroflexi bacterium]|nr:30S ribosome-binding factor RbfA [Chloroflexota bacterium]